MNSVLAQSLNDELFEIVVVNDSGKPLRFEEWQLSDKIRIIDTNRRERSIARNTGAAMARGRYIHFLDDDDWLAPGAFEHLWSLSQISDAIWLYGESYLVDRSGHPLAHLKNRLTGNCFTQVMAGEWIPLQSSLIRADSFFEVGWFNPLLSGPEDIDLLRRIALKGELAEVEAVVSNIVRDDETTTTDYEGHSERSRWARELILSSPGVFARLRSSTAEASWKGRIFRIYSTSMVWNLKNKQFVTAFSRLVFAIGALILAGISLFSISYWVAVSKHYKSNSYHGFSS